MPLRAGSILPRLLAEIEVDPAIPGELPPAGRAWIVLAVFGLAMGLLIAMLILTIGRRSYRRYAKGPTPSGLPSYTRASPWSEAGKRASPAPDEHPPADPGEGAAP